MFDDAGFFTLDVTHPLFDTAIILPKFIRSLFPGTASIYAGYFGTGSTALFGTAALAAGPCLDKPLTTNFFGLGLFTGVHTTVGSNITIGSHTVIGASDVSLSAIMQGLNAFRGKTVPEDTTCTPNYSINAGTIKMNSPSINLNCIVGTGVLGGTWLLNTQPICAPCPTSDLRLKTDIQPLENSLDKILKLQGVSFNWKKELWEEKANENPDGEIGLIAQQVEEVIPEVVREIEIAPNFKIDPEDRMKVKGVKYENLVALLIEGMKEQQQQIEELKERIADLEANK